MQSRIELLVEELCEEIDDLRFELEKMTKDRDEWRNVALKNAERDRENTHKNIGHLLSIALRAEHTADGLLIKEDNH